MSATYLSERELAAPTKERPSILQQRLNLLDDALYKLRRGLIGITVRPGEEGLEPEAVDLGEPRVDEEVDAGPGQGTVGVRRGRDEVGWVFVGEELRDDGRLGDYLAVVG